MVVIQGHVWGVAHCAANVEAHMAEFEGLRASIGCAGAATFGWLKQPVEGHNDEVNDMSVELSADGVLGVNDVTERADDGHVDRAGAGRRAVVFTQLGEEISVQGMELGSSWVAAGIWLTQAGDPLANGREGFSHCISDHRFVLVALASAAHGIDQQVATVEFRVAQVFSEGAGDALLVAERDPVSER